MADIVCLVLSDMVYGEPLMKSFAGFRQMLVIWQRSRYLVEAYRGIFLRAFQMRMCGIEWPIIHTSFWG